MAVGARRARHLACRQLTDEPHRLDHPGRYGLGRAQPSGLARSRLALSGAGLRHRVTYLSIHNPAGALASVKPHAPRPSAAPRARRLGRQEHPRAIQRARYLLGSGVSPGRRSLSILLDKSGGGSFLRDQFIGGPRAQHHRPVLTRSRWAFRICPLSVTAVTRLASAAGEGPADVGPHGVVHRCPGPAGCPRRDARRTSGGPSCVSGKASPAEALALRVGGRFRIQHYSGRPDV